MKIDLTKGKNIFYSYFGNLFDIIRECGKEYKKCHVPHEQELIWQADIRRSLLSEIAQAHGEKRFDLFSHLAHLLTRVERVWLLTEIERQEEDSFSDLLYLEQLTEDVGDSEVFAPLFAQRKQMLLQKLRDGTFTIESGYAKSLLHPPSLENRIEKLGIDTKH